MKSRIMFSDRFIFEPPMNVKNSFYRCDSKFYLDDIIQMYSDNHKIDGIIYANGEICKWLTVINKDFKVLDKESIKLQNQFKNGGQSSNRLSRNRDIQRDHYVTQLAEKTVLLYYDKQLNKQTVCNIIFCGPAEFKRELFEHKLIKSYLKNIHLVTMAELDHQLILDTISNIDSSDELDTINQLQLMIQNADDKLVFGEDVFHTIDMKMLSILYIHHEIDIDGLGIINAYDFKIVKIKSSMIKDYGGMIGVKFY